MTMTSLASVTTAERYPDPTKRWEITKRAMRLWLTITEEKDQWARQDYADWIEGLPAVETNDDYWERLDTVRERAQNDFDDNTNCQEGTERFLETFGLQGLDVATVKYVTVNVTLTFRVENDADIYATREDVRQYLQVDVSGNVDDIGEVDITIDDVDVTDE